MVESGFPLALFDEVGVRRSLLPEIFMPQRSFSLPENPGENYLPVLSELKSIVLKKAAIGAIADSSLVCAEKAGDAIKIAVAQGILERRGSIHAAFDSEYEHDHGLGRKGMRLSWRLSIWTR